MTDHPSSLARADFDRLIARAIKLDDDGKEQVDFEQARAIAQELGISASAWDTALRERESEVQPAGAQGNTWRLRWRAPIISLVGIVAGGLSGAFADQLGDGVLLLGATAIATAVALVLDGVRRRSVRDTRVDLAAWWLSVPAGIMLGMLELHPDAALFAALSWAGCASVGFASHRLRDRSSTPPPLSATPAA